MRTICKADNCDFLVSEFNPFFCDVHLRQSKPIVATPESNGLLRCPFCGSDDLNEFDWIGSHGTSKMVQCLVCKGEASLGIWSIRAHDDSKGRVSVDAVGLANMITASLKPTLGEERTAEITRNLIEALLSPES